MLDFISLHPKHKPYFFSDKNPERIILSRDPVLCRSKDEIWIPTQITTTSSITTTCLVLENTKETKKKGPAALENLASKMKAIPVSAALFVPQGRPLEVLHS